MKHTPLELLLVQDGGAPCLASPEVGHFTAALSRGAVVAAGESAGVLVALGKSFDLIVPEGALGMVANDPPDLVRKPVGYRDVLYRLAPVAGTTAAAAQKSAAASASAGELVLKSAQSGRFYHRPAPAEPPFVALGSVIADGQPIGMLEVMKTFSHVPYRATGALPKRARVVRWIASDGADVRAGDPLFEVERAE
jgi:biotin carboxyl carrier protein